MAQPRILLIGYYGKGNFGDDVLLKVTHALLRARIPDARIFVVVDGDDNGYVQKMLGDVEVLKPGRLGDFDLIVHGGGGVFFDFGAHGVMRRVIGSVLALCGLNIFLKLDKAARRLMSRPRTSAGRRVGLGIGVGTFSSGSARLWQSLPTLADFSALWVRDKASIENLKRFCSVMDAEIVLGSDMAFLTKYWAPEKTVRGEPASRPRLGVILRDWPESHGGVPAQKLREILSELGKEYDITGFVFDTKSDPELLTALESYVVHLWQPQSMSIEDFAQLLAAQNVLLTSRAHGAICGACLGVASVIVNIEQKMEQVHAMLPGASLLVDAHETDRWQEALGAARTIPQAVIASEVARNRAASEAALSKMEAWLQ